MNKRPGAARLDGGSIELHRGDLPEGLDLGNVVAVDTEAMGLRAHRDRLCLVQLSAGDGACHLVQFLRDQDGGDDYDAPNLKALLADERVTKLFHFARFDVGLMYRYLGVVCAPIYCTKIASRLARTYTDRHSLKELCRELIGVDMSKEQQSSDWGRAQLTPEQLMYAASDVLYLHRLRARLDEMLARENRGKLAEDCFRFVPARAQLDVEGWPDEDIFAY
ncbi:MAG: ribonuclease D [Rhodospirillales bacterium]|nr:ribonuclease D [Rhodospirillales bacterium]